MLPPRTSSPSGPSFVLEPRVSRGRRFKYERQTTDRMASRSLRESRGLLREDTRAVEAMPIRLVVAIAVGVAAMNLLLPMAETIETTEEPELTVEPQPRQFALGAEGSRRVRLDVVTEGGKPVEGAKLVVSGKSLPVDGGPAVFRSGVNSNTVTVSVGTGPKAAVPVSFRPTQTRGTLTLAVVPPPGYVDERNNPQITVRRP